MDQSVELAVEGRLVGTLKHHRQIMTLLPVCLGAWLVLDHGIELRARQGIAHANPDVIRQSITDQLDRGHDVREGFTWIAKLEEEKGSDAGLAGGLRANPDLGNV